MPLLLDNWIAHYSTSVIPPMATPDACAPAPARPPLTVLAPADSHEVMREQLDWLIEEAQFCAAIRGDGCGCDSCRRYSVVRALLLRPFAEPAKAKEFA